MDRQRGVRGVPAAPNKKPRPIVPATLATVPQIFATRLLPPLNINNIKK